MRRSIAVLSWILVGALASGASLGYFLIRANHDRARLTAEAADARAQAEQAKASNEKLAQEANDKVKKAEEEVTKAQQLLNQFQMERDLLAKAEPLAKPSPRALRGWKETLSFPLGITIALPPSAVAEDDGNSLLARPTFAWNAEPWLTIARYDEGQERGLAQSLQTPERLTYSVGGRLLVGVRGKLADLPGDVYLFRIVSSGNATHLVWAKASGSVTDRQILDSLATLTFRS